jgi:hypothetical protein
LAQRTIPLLARGGSAGGVGAVMETIVGSVLLVLGRRRPDQARTNGKNPP